MNRMNRMELHNSVHCFVVALCGRSAGSWRGILSILFILSGSSVFGSSA